MLPKPTLSFTIPSQHDGVELKCLIYHPRDLASPSAHVQWNNKAAIIAHPYAALGGSMYDPIVSMITLICLREGFVVGTFNFRGAPGSDGRTSWQSKAEQDDYMSFVGFIAYYLHHLYLSLRGADQSGRSHLELDDSVSAPLQHILSSEKATGQPVQKPRLLLGGYSYGALITMSLPATIQAILAPFQIAVSGSIYAEIRHQAKVLAHEQSCIIKSQSMKIVRLSSSLKLGAGHEQSSSKPTDFNACLVEESQLEDKPNIIEAILEDYQIAYLLISPLCGIVSNLLTMWTFKSGRDHHGLTEKSKKLQKCPTLAIFGDSDIFVSVENLRSWAKTLSAVKNCNDGNRFKYVEIPGASHFWRERESIETLQKEVKAFLRNM